jgi:CDP-4-dehydro-6-deoxyglucose reductase, E3
MPNPQFTKPWHGVPRESIHWNPAILEEACIGCGTCVTGCSRLVYRFDFERKKPVVVDPLNCMVGCTTCANTCPSHAIAFPPIESVLALEGLAQVRHAVEDDLLNRHDILASSVAIPHPDRIVALKVSHIDHPSADVMRVTLTPSTPGECFCEFSAGQYIELWQPEAAQLSRAYSIANSPHGDGSITLHIRQVTGGRFTAWAFAGMKVGDQLKARGPLGNFTMRSPPDVPLLLIAGGTGLAPVLALLEQQVNFLPERDMVLLWGMQSVADFYALDTLQSLAVRAPRLRITLAAATLESLPPKLDHIEFVKGSVMDALLADNGLPGLRDTYVAGPPEMLREIARDLDARSVRKEHLHLDSFGG